MIPALAAVGPVATLLTGVLDHVLPKKMSEAERAAVEAELLKLDWQSVAGQLAINTEEAKSESLFVSGWRPFVGWTCGGSLCWAVLVRPTLEWLLMLCGIDVPPLPNIAAEMTTPILGSLLGIGSMRTYEKIVGANKRR